MASVWFEGIEELTKIAVELEGKAGRVGAQASAIVRASAAKVETLGKQFAPVDTGTLRSSISTDFVGDGRGGAMEAEIGPTVSYGMFLEVGTERMAPHAYMGPALDRVGPEFVAALEKISDPFGG